MTAVSVAVATAQHLLLLGTLERGPVPLPMSGFKSTAASQPARTQIDSRCQKGDDYRSVSLSIFLPPSPPSVLLTSLRSARANTHALIFFFSQISFRPVSIAIPPIFFCLSRIGNTFPKRVLIRKKPACKKSAVSHAGPTYSSDSAQILCRKLHG